MQLSQKHREYWHKSDDIKRQVDSGKVSPTAPVALLDRIAQRIGAPDLDLLPAFQAKVDQDGLFRYYLDGDYHWTADGNQVAADTVAAFLAERGLVPR